jgi:hypothetical protein
MPADLGSPSLSAQEPHRLVELYLGREEELPGFPIKIKAGRISAFPTGDVVGETAESDTQEHGNSVRHTILACPKVVHRPLDPHEIVVAEFGIIHLLLSLVIELLGEEIRPPLSEEAHIVQGIAEIR